MEEAVKGKKESNIRNEGKGKRGWGTRIYNFLAYGGIIIVLFAIVGILILISILTN